MLLILLAGLIFAVPIVTGSAASISRTGLSNLPAVVVEQAHQRDHQWKAATYRGITVGQSTAVEVLQKWGKPNWSGHWEWDNPKSPRFLLYRYDSREQFIGTVTVEAETRTGKVTLIEISPDDLSLNQAIEKLGHDYIKTRYKSCPCKSDLDDESPVFESPDGPLLYIEYRSRGIALAANDNDIINSIIFVSKAIGLKSSEDCKRVSKCNKSERKRGKSPVQDK
ncbi:MAG: hypothetical protein U0Z53_05105 [Blastocatellia bacterium]